MTNEPRLIAITQGEQVEIPLRGEGTSIGRAPSNSVCLGEDDSLSRRHARIHHHLGLHWMEDLGSTNGTFVTLPGLEEVRLRPGDVHILLDGSEIRFGLTARFRLTGLLPDVDSANYPALSAIHARISQDRARLSDLAGQEKKDFHLSLQDYETHLTQAEDLHSLTRLAQEGYQQLSKTILGNLDTDDPGAFSQDLPPLDEDLPDPTAPRPETVKGTILPGLLEKDDEEDADD